MPAPHMTGNSAPCGQPVLHAFCCLVLTQRLSKQDWGSLVLHSSNDDQTTSCSMLECIMHLSFSMTKSGTIVIQASMLCLASLTSDGRVYLYTLRPTLCSDQCARRGPNTVPSHFLPTLPLLSRVVHGPSHWMCPPCTPSGSSREPNPWETGWTTQRHKCYRVCCRNRDPCCYYRW